MEKKAWCGPRDCKEGKVVRREEGNVNSKGRLSLKRLIGVLIKVGTAPLWRQWAEGNKMRRKVGQREGGLIDSFTDGIWGRE